MEIFEHNLEPVRTLWQSPSSRQSLQMIIYKAIAATTDISARDTERIMSEIASLLEVATEQATRPDPAT